MKKLIIISVVFVISLLIVLPIMAALFIKYVPYNIQPPTDKEIGVYGDSIVTQDFVSQKENLTALGLSIRNLNLSNKKDLVITISDAKENIIRNIVINGTNIKDGELIKIVFDPIYDSKNEKYSVKFVSEKSDSSDALRLFYTIEEIPWIDRIIFDDGIESGEFEGRLSLVTYHKPESKLSLIKEIFNSWTKRFFEDRSFALFYIVLISFLVLVISVSKLRQNR